MSNLASFFAFCLSNVPHPGKFGPSREHHILQICNSGKQIVRMFRKGTIIEKQLVVLGRGRFQQVAVPCISPQVTLFEMRGSRCFHTCFPICAWQNQRVLSIKVEHTPVFGLDCEEGQLLTAAPLFVPVNRHSHFGSIRFIDSTALHFLIFSAKESGSSTSWELKYASCVRYRINLTTSV